MDAAAAHPRPLLARIPYLHLGLFLATVVTTVTAGGLGHLEGDGGSIGRVILGGLPFATALISILLCHEMGHYLVARSHRVDATLPFFIPVPFVGVGTFGAVIRIRSAIPSRRAVLDIGAAGPFAGFAVALPLYAWGLAHSEVRVLGDLALEAGNPASPWAALRGLADGLARGLPPGEAWSALWSFGVFERYGESVVTWAVQRAVIGPLPENASVLVHPVAFAAWIGLFITTLNLIPFGQLDGGHVLYALLGGRRAHAASRLVSWGLLAAGVFVSFNWLVWWAITRFFVGARHPPAADDEPLDPVRRLLAYAALALFVLTFVPVPVAL
jgi:membrane-associated protease RseP (regulator of RpoE activity)